jgi:hypothetical protein
VKRLVAQRLGLRFEKRWQSGGIVGHRCHLESLSIAP